MRRALHRLGLCGPAGKRAQCHLITVPRMLSGKQAAATLTASLGGLSGRAWRLYVGGPEAQKEVGACFG